jgi:hypothetical protein
MEDKDKKERSGNNLAYMLETIRGNAHGLVKMLEGEPSRDEDKDMPTQIFDQLETEVMKLKEEIKEAMGGSEKQRIIRRLQVTEKKFKAFMEMNGMSVDIDEDHDEMRERIDEVKMYLDERIKDQMEELKGRFESIKYSINFLTSKQDTFCDKDDAEKMDYEDVKPGLEVFFAINALLESRYVNKEKICR